VTHAFDKHIWNTTKGQFVFDSKACSFQLNELGPVMEDMIDLKLTVKNHNTRSETMRIGFFMENAENSIYSSYDAPELKDGLLELRPGELRELRLKKALPGISVEGNVLWFDVRSAGNPAKILFRARLMAFHAMGAMLWQDPNKQPATYAMLHLDPLKEMRSARTDFTARLQFSPYDKRVFTVLDRGGPAATEAAKSATEAVMIVMEDNLRETVLKKETIPFTGDFAFFLFDVPEITDRGTLNGGTYKATVLLLDKNQRIVGEQKLGPFTYKTFYNIRDEKGADTGRTESWMNNTLGKDDVVWEGFETIKANAAGLETIKHRIAVSPLGLPAQIAIKPDLRDLPLEKRAPGAAVSDADLQDIGRGPQLRGPVELAAVVDGVRVRAVVIKPATLTRTGKSEVEYDSVLKVGPLDVTLHSRYDCDGSLHCRMEYGSDQPRTIDRFELLMPVDGLVDLAFSETGRGGMTAADTWECTLPEGKGIVWDCQKNVARDLAYGRFIPWFWFGSADRAWTWFCDSSEGWVMDAAGDTIQMERDQAGKASFRALFVNHKAEIKGKRTIEFTLLTHPAKNKPKDFRTAAWHYTLGLGWANGYQNEPYDVPEAVLKAQWRVAASAPANLPDSEMTMWRKDEPPFLHFGKWRQAVSYFNSIAQGFPAECPDLDRRWEDKATYLFERQIRVGRRVGWHMDEYFPILFGRSDNVAMGDGYLRSGDTADKTPVPLEAGFTTRNMRDHYKRLARIHQVNNVPQRHQSWANNEATMLESFWWSCLLVEECGAGHRSYDVDVVTQFPNSVYRVLAHNWSGLATAAMADTTEANYGDDKRLDRQLMGRALLNDIGLTPSGPHGIIYHREDMVRLFPGLTAFGFFEDADIEKLPFWRYAKTVRIGDKPSPESEVYVTAYRRPLKQGNGYEALLVVMNESFRPVELPLTLADPARLLGGANTFRVKDARARATAPDELKGWWDGIKGRDAGAPALMDLETGEVVPRVPGAAETYGPVYVPYHDFRVFLARHEEGK